MSILGTIAYVTPLLGLLGTVIGMQGAFSKISEIKGINLTAGVLAQDINLALITTAGGLCVAIPCYVAYNYLVTRIESMTIEMEKSASEILYFFKHHKKLGAGEDYAERAIDQDKK
jgi:biopolymer transport protein ExbB